MKKERVNKKKERDSQKQIKQMRDEYECIESQMKLYEYLDLKKRVVDFYVEERMSDKTKLF